MQCVSGEAIGYFSSTISWQDDLPELEGQLSFGGCTVRLGSVSGVSCQHDGACFRYSDT